MKQTWLQDTGKWLLTTCSSSMKSIKPNRIAHSRERQALFTVFVLANPSQTLRTPLRKEKEYAYSTL
jgi:hypothetical protein